MGVVLESSLDFLAVYLFISHAEWILSFYHSFQFRIGKSNLLASDVLLISRCQSICVVLGSIKFLELNLVGMVVQKFFFFFFSLSILDLSFSPLGGRQFPKVSARTNYFICCLWKMRDVIYH